MSFQNVIDAGGIGLSLTGMTIVFVSLVLVSLFIFSLPRLLPLVNRILPEVESHHGAPIPSSATPQTTKGVEEEVVAAIGFAMHSCDEDSQDSG